MHKLCLLLVASSTFAGESVGSVTGGNQTVVAAHNAGTVPRVDDASSDSPGLVRPHDRAVDETASTTADLNLKSKGSTVSPSERDLEDRVWSAILEKLTPAVSWAAPHWKVDGNVVRLHTRSREPFTPVQAAPQLLEDQAVLTVRKMSREELLPDQTIRYIDNIKRRDVVTRDDLTALMQLAHRDRDELGRPLNLDAAYKKLKGNRPLDAVFDRLISLSKYDDVKVQELVAHMHNKLAKDISAKLGKEASNWMAEKWKKVAGSPGSSAMMIGIDERLVLQLPESAALWVDYYMLMRKANPENVPSYKWAERILTNHLKEKEKMSFLRKVWPDYEDFVKTQAKMGL